MEKNNKILVLGSNGLVGSAIVRELNALGFNNILAPKRNQLELLNQNAVKDFFAHHKPEYVFMCAAKVGGIHANSTYRADFILENLEVQNNVLSSAWKSNLKGLLFLGSSCIYPKNCIQPMKEEYLLSGPLEETNEPYAVAKIAGLKLVENLRRQYGCPFYSVMPTNLYGPNDNYHPENSHVIPGLIARMAEAIRNNDPVFKCWGTGNPRREFLYVDDMASACIEIMKLSHKVDLPYLINIGSGVDVTIKDLVMLIKKAMNYKGDIVFDSSKPDGTLRKLLDVSKLNSLGWKPKISLEEGLKIVVDRYLNGLEKRL